MPTAARLVSAVWFAMVAAAAAELFRLSVDPSVPMPRLMLLAVLAGVFGGWVVMGPRAGRGIWMSLVGAIQTTVVIAFWVLLFIGIDRMLTRAWNRIYRDPVEAVLGAFDLMFQSFRTMIAEPTVMAALLVGTLVGGILAELTARRWK